MSLIVETDQGKLQGKENTSLLSGKTYYSFMGIPYAKPPLGDLRFKSPEPSEKWEGIYDATYERDECIQIDYILTGKKVGSEDCLYLNIDTPQVPSEIKVPKAVMVFIHGGGFYAESGSEKIYSGDFLINHDIIYVRMNYRLHALGFLNLGLEDCRGNAGLRDQALALRWVKNNISKFGGDPNNITIFGSSAGASAVHLQILSPLTKGLFHKAIIQSGSGLNVWALGYDYKEMADELGERLGFKGGSRQDLLQFLKTKSADELTQHVMAIDENLNSRCPGKCTAIPFLPTVEEIKEGAFLPDYPKKLLETTQPLPMIYGVVNKEGMVTFTVSPKNILDVIREDFSIVLKYNFKIEPDKLAEVCAKVKQYYFGDKEVSQDTVDQLIDLYTDMNYYDLYEAIEFATNSSTPPFLYEYTYDGGLNSERRVGFAHLKPKTPGAYHGDELDYLLYARGNPQVPKFEGDDLIVIQTITKLWTNFAKTGSPTDESTWPASTSSQPRYLEINRNIQLKEGKLFGERLQFLKDLLGPADRPFDVPY